jgi:hypothetical protein
VIAAFLILAHNHPKQVARLVDSLPGDSPIVIHFDARADSVDWSMLTGLLGSRPATWFARRCACFWGTFSLVKATIAMIRTLSSTDVHYDRVTLLSGADYPLVSARELKVRLADAPTAEHLECFDLERPNRWDANAAPFRTEDLYSFFHVGFRSRLYPLFRRKPRPVGLTLYGGTQWWSLTRDCFQYVDQFIADNPRFVSFFRHCRTPDEVFFQTIIAHSPFRNAITGSDLTLAYWDRPPPRPSIITMSDLDALQTCRDKLFARKFDLDRDSDVLDALDKAAGRL